MESQLSRPSHDHHHYEEDDPHNVGLHSGEGEHHHHHGEKKSVLKKVKDKAKKIKDTIKKHGHGHGQDDDHQHPRRDDNQEGCEEDSDDEEMDNDPEVHGAPIYESSAMRSATIPVETHTNLEKPTDTREDRYDHNVRDQLTTRPLATGPPMEARLPENKTTDTGLIDRNVPHVLESTTKIGHPVGIEEHPHAPYNSPASDYQYKVTHPTHEGLDTIGRNVPNVEEPKTKIGSPVGLEEDPHAPYNNRGASNYQSKVTDPMGAGGKEANVGPLVREFGNLNVGDAPLAKPGSDQRTEMASLLNPESKLENPEMNTKDQDSSTTGNTSIAEKISSATYSVVNRAASAKDMVASKLGYGGAQQEGEGVDSSPPAKPISESASEYAHKVAETLAPVYGKVAGAGSAVMSKVHGGEGGKDSVSMKEYLSEKFRPGEEDKALSEAITNALQKRKGEEKKVGKVTVSKEVEARLGSEAENKREGEDAVEAGRESVGQGVMDRLRDAVGVWLGKSNGIETAKESVSKSYVSGAGSGSSGVGPS